MTDRLRLVAAVTGVDADLLEREHLRRVIRRTATGGIGAVMVTAGLVGLALWAMRAAAEAQKETAHAISARTESIAAADTAQKAEDLANAEARKTNQTTNFFISMFEAPNAPALAGNILFADLLERACRRLIPIDGGAPEITDRKNRSDLLIAFAQSLAHLGKSKIADEAMAAAIADRKATAEWQEPDFKVVFDAAEVAILSLNFERALVHLNNLWEARRDTGRGQEMLDVRIASSIAHCLLRTGGSTTEVKMWLRNARDAAANLDAESTQPVLVTLLKVEALYYSERLNDKPTANRQLREALAICSRASYCGDSRDWPEVALNVVELDYDSPAERISLADKASRRVENLLGSHHPRAIYAKVLFAAALQKDYRHIEAVRVLQPLMNGVLKDKSKAPLEYTRAVSVLAYSLTELGRIAEAMPLVENLIREHESRHDTSSPSFADAIELKALALKKERRTAEAIDAANRALAIREALGGPHSLDLWDPLFLIAGCHGDAGNRVPEIATLERLVTILNFNNLEMSDRAAQLHMALGLAYAATGDVAQWHHYAFQAVEICERAGIKGYVVADTLAVKGAAVCFGEKRLLEGLPLLERSLRIAVETIGRDDRRLIPLLEMLRSAAVAAGNKGLLDDELADTESPEALLEAANAAIELLETTKPLGQTLAREAQVILAEQAAQSAESKLFEEPEIAAALANRGESWLGPKSTADSPRARATRARLILLHALSDLIGGRPADVVARLRNTQDHNRLPRDLLLILAIACVQTGDDEAAIPLLADCGLRGQKPWPEWPMKTIGAAASREPIATALHQLRELCGKPDKP